LIQGKGEKTMALTKKHILTLVLAVLICLMMMPQQADASANKGSRGFSGKAATSASADRIIKVAKSKLGCPYVSGAAGPRSFDCSGFVAYCMKKSGVKLTRGTAASYFKKKYNVGSDIRKAHKGDIVLYTAGSGIGHCALYIGKGNVIHATCHGGIRITSYDGIGQRVVAIIRTYTPAGNAKISAKSAAGMKYMVSKKGYKKVVKAKGNGVAKLTGLKTGKYKVTPVAEGNEVRKDLTKSMVVKNDKTAKVRFGKIEADNKIETAGDESEPAVQ
jgi:hypothetical protein